MKITVFLVGLCLCATVALGQPSMGVYVDRTPGDLGDPLDEGVVTVALGTSFDLVVVVSGIPQDFFTYEFSITPLEVVTPGLMKVGETLYQGTFDAGDVPGEYIIGIGGCAVETGVELLRVSYSAASVVPGDQTVVTLSGTDPSGYFGPPGLTACDGTSLPASFVVNGGVDACGAAYPNGSVMLNGCQPQPIETPSFGQIKARF